jgi:hypothetical protein
LFRGRAYVLGGSRFGAVPKAPEESLSTLTGEFDGKTPLMLVGGRPRRFNSSTGSVLPGDKSSSESQPFLSSMPDGYWDWLPLVYGSVNVSEIFLSRITDMYVPVSVPSAWDYPPPFYRLMLPSDDWSFNWEHFSSGWKAAADPWTDPYIDFACLLNALTSNPYTGNATASSRPDSVPRPRLLMNPFLDYLSDATDLCPGRVSLLVIRLRALISKLGVQGSLSRNETLAVASRLFVHAFGGARDIDVSDVGTWPFFVTSRVSPDGTSDRYGMPWSVRAYAASRLRRALIDIPFEPRRWEFLINSTRISVSREILVMRQILQQITRSWRNASSLAIRRSVGSWVDRSASVPWKKVPMVGMHASVSALVATRFFNDPNVGPALVVSTGGYFRSPARMAGISPTPSQTANPAESLSDAELQPDSQLFMAVNDPLSPGNWIEVNTILPRRTTMFSAYSHGDLVGNFSFHSMSPSRSSAYSGRQAIFLLVDKWSWYATINGARSFSLLQVTTQATYPSSTFEYFSIFPWLSVAFARDRSVDRIPGIGFTTRVLMPNATDQTKAMPLVILDQPVLFSGSMIRGFSRIYPSGCYQCPALNYMADYCSFTAWSTVCRHCETCIAGQSWRVGECSPEANRPCTACSSCPAGYIEVSPCTTVSDTACAALNISVLAFAAAKVPAVQTRFFCCIMDGLVVGASHCSDSPHCWRLHAWYRQQLIWLLSIRTSS